MIIDEVLSRIKTSRMMAYLSRPFTRRAGPIYHRTLLDGQPINDENFVMADDPKCLRYAEAVGDRLTKEFPARYDQSTGFCDSSGVPGDFNSVRCVSQYGQDPLPMPLVDNAALVKDAGLASSIRPEDLPWFKELMSLFYGAAVPQNLHIKTKGTTAAPDFEKADLSYKKLGTIKILKSLPTLIRLVSLKRGLDILNEYRILFMSVIMSRLQPDSVFVKDGKWATKQRLAPTPDEARSGLAAKNYADKRVKDRNGDVIDGHFAMRMRDVFAFNGLLNYAISAIMGCFRAVYTNRFAATFKTRGAEDKRVRISKYRYIAGSDVKTMDKLIPRWFIDLYHELLCSYLDEGIVEIMAAMFKAPYLYAPNGTYPADFNPLVGGDPLKLDANNHPGLPSGIAQNPDIGKIWMVFNYMIATRDCGGLATPRDIEPWLAGDNPDYGLQDMADDATFMTNVQRSVEDFKVYKSPYCVMEQEIPVIFLGDVYCTDDQNNKIVLPNPVSYPVNEIAREDSVASKPIAQVALGRSAREEIYARCPIYRDMKAIMREEQIRCLGFDVYSHYSKVSMPVGGMSDPDLLFQMNPNVIHFKIDPDDVTPSLLSQHVSTIDADVFWDDIRPFFKFKTSPYSAANQDRLAMRSGSYF